MSSAPQTYTLDVITLSSPALKKFVNFLHTSFHSLALIIHHHIHKRIYMSFLTNDQWRYLAKCIKCTARGRTRQWITKLVGTFAVYAGLIGVGDFQYTVRPLSITTPNCPVIIQVKKNKNLVMLIWCHVDGEDRAMAEYQLTTMLVKHNVDCGFLVDADKAVFYSLFYMHPNSEAVELRTYVFRTQAQEILELLHGFTAHNSVYPDEDEMGMVAATLSV